MLTVLLLIAAAVGMPSARNLLPDTPDAPGCALDVRRDGLPIDAATTGLANLEDRAPITPDTVFEIGSVSKQFVGAGVAYLAQHGRLRLDDPIRQWLPELPRLYRDVTIAMLVHHTSGIRSWNNLAELTGRGEDSTGYDNAWVLRAVARQRGLNNVPGTEYLYSNSNFVLAAIIIERASGRPLNEFFRDALFGRLGMSHTQWRTNFKAIVRDRAQAYLPDDHGGWQLDIPLNDVAGAGGLLSTVGDLQRWNAALASPSPQDRAWAAMLIEPGALNDGTSLRYGMGIEIAPVGGVAAFAHAGSTGSYRAWLGAFPSQRLSIALLCNSGAVNTEDLGPGVAARFLPTGGPDSTVAGSTATVPAELAGLYRNVANDSAVEARIDAKGLHLNDGPSFGAVGRDRLATANSQRTASVRRAASGAFTGLTVTRIGNAPVTLERVAKWTPTLRELARLVGGYTSPEIDGVQRIELVGGALVWRDPGGSAHPLVPTYRNAFDAPDASWTLRFRTEAGVPALDMSITRARKVTFRRFTPSKRPNKRPSPAASTLRKAAARSSRSVRPGLRSSGRTWGSRTAAFVQDASDDTTINERLRHDEA